MYNYKTAINYWQIDIWDYNMSTKTNIINIMKQKFFAFFAKATLVAFIAFAIAAIIQEPAVLDNGRYYSYPSEDDVTGYVLTVTWIMLASLWTMGAGIVLTVTTLLTMKRDERQHTINMWFISKEKEMDVRFANN